MNMLIIFFSILLLFILILFLKIKLNIIIYVYNNDADIELKIVNRKINKKVNFFERRMRSFKNKSFKDDITLFYEIVERMEIEKLNIDVKFGTKVLFLSTLITVLIGTIVPTFFALPFRKKQNLTFNITPDFYKSFLEINVEAIIKFQIYDLILILIKLREKRKYRIERISKRYM